MKKTASIVVLFLLLSLVLTGCGDSTLAIGTYQNENNSQEQIIITETTIQFVNVSFDDYSEEFSKTFGADINFTEFFSAENYYTVEDGLLKVEYIPGLSISFEFGKDYIYSNEVKFKLC